MWGFGRENITVFTPSSLHVAATARTEGSGRNAFGYFPRPCRPDDVSGTGMLFQLLTWTVMYVRIVVRVAIVLNEIQEHALLSGLLSWRVFEVASRVAVSITGAQLHRRSSRVEKHVLQYQSAVRMWK